VSSLPLILYKRETRGKSRAVDHPLYAVLHDAANEDTASNTLIEAMMTNVLLWGNAFAQIVLNPDGSVRELWPLESRYMSMRRYTDGGLLYDYTAPTLSRTFQRYEIFHVPGLTLNGVTGLSVLGYWRRAIGLGLVLDSFTEAFYENGANPGLVFEHPGVLSTEAKENIVSSWVAKHGGVENSNKPDVLEEGMKLNTYGMPLDDAQFIESKKFQANEIARLFRVPPHKIGILDNATFSNIESQGRDHVTSSLRPWLVRFEKRISLDLLLPSERRQYFAEFLVDALLRGNLLDRYQAYAIGRNWGWLSADDVLEIENANPLPGGKGQTYLSPLNMQQAALETVLHGQEHTLENVAASGNGNGRH
jgi:HK97 family phage portal protein